MVGCDISHSIKDKLFDNSITVGGHYIWKARAFVIKRQGLVLLWVGYIALVPPAGIESVNVKGVKMLIRLFCCFLQAQLRQQ